MYFYKAEDLISGNLMNYYAQNRYFLHFTYASLLSLLQLNFKNVELISAFFAYATIFPLYLLGRDLFDDKTGLIAALLYSFNPSVIFYSIRFLPVNLSLFLLTSFMLFFVKWIERGNRFYLALMIITLTAASLVKLHGIVFAAIATLFTLMNSNKKQKVIFLSIFVTLFASTLIFTDLLRIILWKLSKLLTLSIVDAGYSAYITYFAPDYYTLPFVVAFFSGISALKDSKKLLFLVTPIILYVVIFTVGPGLGIRHFLPVLPYMALLAAYGILRRPDARLLILTLLLYLSTLGVMFIAAPKIPHLVYIIPDVPLSIRIFTFSLAALVLLCLIKGRSPQKVVLIIIVACVANTVYFIGFQSAYPDHSEAGLEEAGKWFDENTPENAVIQSTTGETKYWLEIHSKAHPNEKYPKSTYLDCYTSRKTVAVPDSEEELLRRIEKGEIDYVVVFSHPVLTENVEALKYRFVRKYLHSPPNGTIEVYRWYNSKGGVGFVIYGKRI
ncbi:MULTISPECIES: ArnT family glycosyltransferase [unclassified Archaeoglobus]|uniref:ArnT family glycosyltransferase n=1 Tax=unclassified Archaeoglobus TaxID=2643606 RepID=UPI0025BAF8C6|nr:MULTISPECIES: glycosyltransferase family 39 protein [unclassified Archaeoglobus]